MTWHLLGDLLGWTAVLVVSIVLMFNELLILDPILSILITSYVLYNVLLTLKKTMQLFLQAVPDTVDIPEIEKQLMAIEKVKSVHHTHVWSLDGERNMTDDPPGGRGGRNQGRRLEDKKPGEVAARRC